ncbi:hypothetical protein DPEC_G00192530 [Dallia pectoralis]|uniref:Uncharacterized protein n=1 Tax=Dallia pectoralis TaxID=75939 RepID=A0ACC2GCM8_DALPE|nr:hypothetical protein DPEC_G00192530 [Dallia pectoralis]
MRAGQGQTAQQTTTHNLPLNHPLPLLLHPHPPPPTNSDDIDPDSTDIEDIPTLTTQTQTPIPPSPPGPTPLVKGEPEPIPTSQSLFSEEDDPAWSQVTHQKRMRPPKRPNQKTTPEPKPQRQKARPNPTPPPSPTPIPSGPLPVPTIAQPSDPIANTATTPNLWTLDLFDQFFGGPDPVQVTSQPQSRPEGPPETPSSLKSIPTAPLEGQTRTQPGSRGCKITPMSSQGVTISTLNTRNIRYPDRRRTVLGHLTTKPADIFLLQECGIPYKEEGWTLGSSFWSGSNIARADGVGILMTNPYIRPKASRVVESTRILVLDLEIQGSPLRVINVYGPTNVRERVSLYRKLRSLLLVSTPVLVGGDFNCALRDEDHSKPRRDRSSKELQAIIDDFSLTDVGGSTPPTPTWVSSSGASYSRID